MIDFLRYGIHDTFWSLSYGIWNGDVIRSIVLLRFGWYECIALTALMLPSAVSFLTSLRPWP